MINILITTILIASTLQARELFSKLPYGIEFGKELPPKVKSMSSEKYEDIYIIKGKFFLNTKKFNGGVLANGLEIYNKEVGKETNSLPKKWKKAGIKYCHKYDTGSSPQQIQKIITDNGGFDIKQSITKQNKDEIVFRIGKDKEYLFEFYREPTDRCKGGLDYISISEFEINDDEY